MGSVPMDALEPGMMLAEDLQGPDGKMLLPKGCVLTEQHLRSLRARGVTHAVIATAQEANADTPPDPALIETAENHLRPFFLANKADHPFLEALYRIAVTRLAQNLAQGHPLPPDLPPNPRAESMGDLFFRAEGGARDIVANEVKLATFPDIYFKIRHVLDSPTSTPAEVADVVSKDTSLAAKLLRLVNSPFYGLPQRIDSISRAIMVIGGQEISTLALGISAINAFKDIPQELISMRTFWEHSVAVGVFARVLGKAVGHDEAERLFVAGMLHDIGRLIIFKKLPHAALETIYYAQSNQMPLHMAENDMLGFAHPLVGGLLLRAWKFPEPLVAIVACHHKPSALPNDIEPAILHVADIMAIALGFTPPASAMVPTLEDTAWTRLGLAATDVPALAEDAFVQIEDIVTAFFPTAKK